MLNKRADLHIHSFFSDGTFSPEKITKLAAQKGLSAIAITDHDCIDAIGPSLEIANKRGPLEVVPGVELSCEIDGCEVHMLGYFIDYKDNNLIKALKSLVDMRNSRMFKMLKNLTGLGMDLSIDDVKKIKSEGTYGRLHLAALLLNKGYVRSIQEAFDKFLGFGKPCYVSGDRISPTEAIAMIINAGGAAVLGHPYSVNKDEYIPGFVKAGLAGIEAYHTDHPEPVVNRYKKIAEQFGLIITGGSDCHGAGKGRALIGNITVPYEVVEELRCRKVR